MKNEVIMKSPETIGIAANSKLAFPTVKLEIG